MADPAAELGPYSLRQGFVGYLLFGDQSFRLGCQAPHTILQITRGDVDRIACLVSQAVELISRQRPAPPTGLRVQGIHQQRAQSEASENFESIIHICRLLLL